MFVILLYFDAFSLKQSEATESLESFSSSDSSKNVPYVSMGGCCQKNKSVSFIYYGTQLKTCLII